MPIQPDYCGIQVDSINNQRLTVKWKENDGEDAVYIYKKDGKISVSNLLGIKYLSENDINLIFETTNNFKEVINRKIKRFQV